jgi:hypothetical protein
MNWKTAASASITTDFNTNSNGYTWRQVVSSGDISNTGRPYVRVSFKSSSGGVFNIDKAYIGQAADSGDAYDFNAAPVELLFSGASGFNLSANSTIVSDTTPFAIPSGKNLVVSWYSNQGLNEQNMKKDAKTNWNAYTKAADDCTTTNTSGYATTGANSSYGISLIEAGANVGGVMMYFDRLKWKALWQPKGGIWQPNNPGLVTI